MARGRAVASIILPEVTPASDSASGKGQVRKKKEEVPLALPQAVQARIPCIFPIAGGSYQAGRQVMNDLHYACMKTIYNVKIIFINSVVSRQKVSCDK